VASSILDGVDERIVHGLVVEPRVPFRILAQVAGVSPQTAARRYRRLQDVASLRVSGRVAAPRAGWSDWYVRLHCVPGAAAAIAAALARRADTRWVVLASGGTEIICSLQARSPGQRDEFLLDRLPASRRVVGLTAHSLLKNYSRPAWSRLTRALTDAECGLLSQVPQGTPGAPRGPLDAHDERLLDALTADGRASSAALALTTGWHESTIRRRIAELRCNGILQFDVDIDEAVFGVTTYAMLWASIDPGRLDDVGEAMATHVEVPFVSATTGPANLMATLVCRDTNELHTYLTRRLASLPGVQAIETTPLIRALKRSGPANPPKRG
jgi:DNA-binding Lrp family transcriptional regulator